MRGDGAGVSAQKNEYAHDQLIKEALTWIRKNKTSPFFLCLTVTVPHANNEAGDEGMEVPNHGIYKNKDWPEPQKGLAAMISRLLPRGVDSPPACSRSPGPRRRPAAPSSLRSPCTP